MNIDSGNQTRIQYLFQGLTIKTKFLKPLPCLQAIHVTSDFRMKMSDRIAANPSINGMEKSIILISISLLILSGILIFPFFEKCLDATDLFNGL